MMEQSNINAENVAGRDIIEINILQQNVKSIKRFDKSIKDNHFNIYPNTDYHIDKLFIFSNINCTDINNLEKKDIGITSYEEIINFINKNKITFIHGGYGTGKSILAKKLNHDLKEIFKVLYFYSSDLEVYINKCDLELEYDLEDKPTIIIIDSIDELNSIDEITKKKSADLITKFVKCLKTNHKLIITTRLIKNSINSIDEYSEILFGLDIFIFGVITIKPFTSKNIREWIDNYSLFKNKTKEELFLNYIEIKKWKKGLLSAVQNPLLLFLFCENYLNKEPDYDIRDIYHLYDDFIKKTVKGKFDLETKLGSSLLTNIQNEYKEILKKIAFSIMQYNYNKNYSNTDNEYLDPNEDIYSIPEDNIDETLKIEIEKFITLSCVKKNEVKILKYNLLNCYFFDYQFNNLKFKDNNILFFFIAEKYFEIIDKYLLNDFNSLYNKLLEHTNISLNTIIIELLIQKLRNVDYQQQIAIELESMIKQGYFINFNNEEHIKSFSLSKINCDILLSIIYLSLNNPSKKYLEHFIKRITWYTSMVKRIDGRILYLVKRFFRKCNFNSTVIRRINLTGFNFEKSNFKDVIFIQNKIHEARFNYSEFFNTEFYLSDIENTDFKGIKGALKFKTCNIIHININEHEIKEMIFTRCLVQDITLHSKNKLCLVFKNCDLRNIKIIKSCIESIELDECFFDQFDFKGSMIKSFIAKNSHCRVKNICEIDGQSDIKKIEYNNHTLNDRGNTQGLPPFLYIN